MSYQKLFRSLSQGKKVRLGSTDAELSDAQVSIAFDDQPLYAVMDAMAAMFLADWTRKGLFYDLDTGRHGMDAGFSTHNPYMEERMKYGAAFISSVDKMNDAQKRQLMSPEGNAFSSLPSALRESIQQMAKCLAEEYDARGSDSARSVSAGLPQSQVRVEPKGAPAGITEYFITIANDSGSMGWRIHNYEQARKRLNQESLAAPPDAGTARYRTTKFELSPDDTKQMPAAQKVVTLHERNVTFPHIMRLLHERDGIPFVTELPATMPQKANVELEPMPLGEALDRLTELYEDTEWEMRRSGFVLVRGPKHPGRDRKKENSPIRGSDVSPDVSPQESGASTGR